MLVQRDGELPTISNSAKKCFIFITFISMYHVGKEHLNLSPNTPQLQGMHLLIPLCKTSLKRYFSPFKLKPVKELSTGPVSSIEAGSEFLRKWWRWINAEQVTFLEASFMHSSSRSVNIVSEEDSR